MAAKEQFNVSIDVWLAEAVERRVLDLGYKFRTKYIRDLIEMDIEHRLFEMVEALTSKEYKAPNEPIAKVDFGEPEGEPPPESFMPDEWVEEQRIKKAHEEELEHSRLLLERGLGPKDLPD